jgi:hypothetical protein
MQTSLEVGDADGDGNGVGEPGGAGAERDGTGPGGPPPAARCCDRASVCRPPARARGDEPRVLASRCPPGRGPGAGVCDATAGCGPPGRPGAGSLCSTSLIEPVTNSV